LGDNHTKWITSTSLSAPQLDKADQTMDKASNEQTITDFHLPLVLDKDEEDSECSYGSNNELADQSSAQQKMPTAAPEHLVLPVLSSLLDNNAWNVTRSISMPVVHHDGLLNLATLHLWNTAGEEVPIANETAKME
jgi:hypothetical protein